MDIKPLELANICSIFISSRSSKIRLEDLIRYQSFSMLIDSNNSPIKIIQYSIEIGMLKRIDRYIYLSEIAKILGKFQGKPDYKLNGKAKDYIVKNILLNTIFIEIGFITIIKLFKPVSPYQTYVYFRTFEEDSIFLNWLKSLNTLGFTTNESNLILVKKEYLQMLNYFLFKVRNGGSVDIEKKNDKKTETGESAEILALEFEKMRLIKNGYPELARLIQRISLIDNYIGYDILSFQGAGRNPTKSRFIEVKGTEKNNFQFVFTRNERIVGSEKGLSYWIYCFKNVKSTSINDYKPLLINNPIMRLKKMEVIEEPIDIFYSFK